MTVDCPEEIFKQKAQKIGDVGGRSDEGEEASSNRGRGFIDSEPIS